uniref:Ovule protein n=1 Tax=Heterorhabditis bacteriophora TaxID=37862 RepID=A0A1I7X1D6_HETBA
MSVWFYIYFCLLERVYSISGTIMVSLIFFPDWSLHMWYCIFYITALLYITEDEVKSHAIFVISHCPNWVVHR